MDTVYTTTITSAAKARGIAVNVLDPVLPIFELQYNNNHIRCYNGLTDLTGGASFHLAQDKGAANRYLRKLGFHVPDQEVFTNYSNAINFLDKNKSIVVKPISQWGGRGVSTDITNKIELRKAIIFAKRYSDDIVLEKCVEGIDWRLIYVNYEFISAIQRNPASVTGNGQDSIKTLIKEKNKKMKEIDSSNQIPLNSETLRCLESQNMNYYSIPHKDRYVQVRRTSNYHTGGTVDIVTDKIPENIKIMGKSISKLLKIPVIGVDILYDSNGDYNVIELSPDLAISPPEGHIVVEAYLDLLFPESQSKKLEKDFKQVFQNEKKYSEFPIIPEPVI